MLYNQKFSTPGIHTVVLRNEYDERGMPQGNSQLVVVSFVLMLPTPSMSTGSVQTTMSSGEGGIPTTEYVWSAIAVPSTVNTPGEASYPPSAHPSSLSIFSTATTTSAALPLPIPPTSSTAASFPPSSQHSFSPGAIVGTTLATLALICLGLLLLYRRRLSAYKFNLPLPSMTPGGTYTHPSESVPSAATHVPTIKSLGSKPPSLLPSWEYGYGYGYGMQKKLSVNPKERDG